MPLQETSGNLTTDAFGGGAAVVKYIEDYFQTWLRTGTGASATITTGLDASTNKALVWTKSRSAATDHKLTDTVRGATKALISDTTGAQTTDTNGLTAFSSTGYTIGTDTNYNNSGATYIDWEFVATPKFFDIVTYTGTGSAQNIAHNLGSVPGCVIVKNLNTAQNWQVYHQSVGNTQALQLNGTAAASAANSIFWNNTTPTSTQFTVGTANSSVGDPYVAYIFAHNAGGFGLTGTDNVISCGSFTSTSGGTASITLGYEPQWVMIKCTSTSDSWYITDTMRGMPASPDTTSPYLVSNTSASETAWGAVNGVNATGWSTGGLPSSQTFIYIAIRRGPMKVPTDATKVFLPYTYTGNGGSNRVITPPTNSPADLMFGRGRSAGNNTGWYDRLRGKGSSLTSNTTSAESVQASSPEGTLGQNNFTVDDTYGFLNNNGVNYAMYLASRAPSFFDEVCYTGTGANTTQTHNLGVVPELVIVKARSAGSTNWLVYPSSTSFGNALYLNTTTAYVGSGPVGAQSSTTVRFDYYGNPAYSASTSGTTYVAYLFATCAGVSKVGSYTGNGTTQTIACGFTSGARFVLIKRTDATGDWYVYDTARGMTTLTDPYLLVNDTAAESATLGSVTTVSTGFAVNASILAAINTNAATYIYLSIA
jgi:hypothetical protein